MNVGDSTCGRGESQKPEGGHLEPFRRRFSPFMGPVAHSFIIRTSTNTSEEMLYVVFFVLNAKFEEYKG